MINFLSVKFKNFQSYGNAETSFTFNSDGTNLINGENGAGKSSIISALVYACYGKSTEGLKDNDLINNINGKNMEVTVIFEKGGMYYKVYRGRKTKDGDQVRLWENDVNDFPSTEVFNDNNEKTLVPAKFTNAKVERIINISYELFIRIVVFSANSKPFFELTPRTGAANQSDIIEELFEITELAANAEKLKDKTKETDTTLQVEMSKSEMVVKELERYKVQITNIETRIAKWDVDTKDTINKLKTALGKVEDVSLEDEKGFHQQRDDLQKEINDVESKIKTLKSHIRDELCGKMKLITELEHLNDAECPYCFQKFEAPEKIKACGETIKKHEEAITLTEEAKGKLDDELRDYLTNMDLIKDSITIDNLEELLAIQNQKEVILDKIDDLKQSVNPHNESLGELNDSPVKPHDMTLINDLTTRKEHQKFLYKLLTDKNSFIRKTLLNKHLPYLNERLYYYLMEMNLPHTVEFGQDLSAVITKYGKTLNFKSLSTGQRSRVNLALSFAFRDILQKIYGMINIYILDEVLDRGLDSEGVELAAKLLKRKAIEEDVSIYIITHRNELDNFFDKIITVEMDNNFSRIKE